MSVPVIVRISNYGQRYFVKNILKTVSHNTSSLCISGQSTRTIFASHKNLLQRQIFSSTLLSSPIKGADKHIVSKSLPLISRIQDPLYTCFRHNSSHHNSGHGSKTSTTMYAIAGGIGMLGVCFLGVPLYRIFCQKMGMGGSPTLGHKDVISGMTPVEDRIITVTFIGQTDPNLKWIFKPKQRAVKVAPGETALAFFTAKNETDKPIIGISTYNVTPPEAALYFNKIQCFCFEEQRLNPKEEVDMPVFFYIDPEFDDDPRLELYDEVTLSYTFFESKEGMTLPLPGYPVKQPMAN